MTPKLVDKLLEVLTRHKVQKFQMDKDTVAVEFGGGCGEDSQAVGFTVQQEEEEEEDEG